MDVPVISVENLSKAYRVWNSPTSRLIAPIADQLAGFLPQGLSTGLRERAGRAYHDFYALSGIDFSVFRGESLGIIGRNGSGKSTLLQIIAGTLQPSSGRVVMNGRVAALLELGSGFNPEFTGRENVYLNGVLLGLSRSEIDERYDDIASFADIGDYIDQPVKTYSSGMMVRLAFAVAISVDPDILIVDEALSVGDIFFQQKCFKRVHQMLDSGVSLLFVSHDTVAVQNLCSRALYLRGGNMEFIGPPEEAVSRYYSMSAPAVSSGGSGMVDVKPSTLLEKYLDSLSAGNMASEANSSHGEGRMRVDAVVVLDHRGNPSRTFRVGDPMHIVVRISALTTVLDPSSGIHLFDRMNVLVFAAGTRQLNHPIGDLKIGESRVLEFVLTLDVIPGEYTFSVGCSEPSSDGPNHGVVQHRLEGLGPINVVPSVAAHESWPFYGVARLPLTLNFHG